jgi:hypothetical protein
MGASNDGGREQSFFASSFDWAKARTPTSEPFTSITLIKGKVVEEIIHCLSRLSTAAKQISGGHGKGTFLVLYPLFRAGRPY